MIEKSCITFISKPKLSLSLIGLIVIIYVSLYNPFIFESFIDRNVRFGVEVSVLLLLLLINLTYKPLSNLIWWIALIMLYMVLIMFGVNKFTDLSSSLNKFIFIFFLIGLLRGNRDVLNILIKLWMQLWYVLCVIAVVAFLGYNSGAINFSPWDLGEATYGIKGSYYYLHSSILGNISPKIFFGMDMGRASAFLYEGGLLGVFCGINILSAKYWFETPKGSETFVRANYLAGITTLSTTFIIFFLVYFLLSNEWLKNKFSVMQRVVFYSFMLIVFLNFIVLVILEESSGSARLESLIFQLNIMGENSLNTFLFGNGIGYTINNFEFWGGVSSGWISIFVERGVLFLIFTMCLIVKLTKNSFSLLLFLIYCNFSFNVLLSPALLLIIGTTYHCMQQRTRPYILKS